MTELARKLRVVDYFTLGWGTMVGVGWLVVMDDWLLRGGSLGAVLGFAIGGALLLPIGYVYGQLVMAMPDAAGEVAYTAKVFPPAISFATGWMMVLSYFIVCPWEAVAIGKIAGYIFPSLDSLELYRIVGRPVYLPHLVIGLGLIALLTVLNYRGIGLSPAFYSRRFCFRIAGHAGRSLLHDRLRIGSEGGGGAQPGIQRTWLLHSNLDGNCCGDSLLHDRNCSGGIRRSLEKIDG